METKKVSLFQINAEQKAMIEEIESLGGELTPEMEEALMINEQQLQKKSIAYLEVIKTTEAFNDLVDSEIKRLQALKKARTNLIKKLKDNLLLAVKTFGDFEIGTVRFGTRASTTVEIYDASKVPQKYTKKVLSVSPDKAKIKKALTDGEEVKGAKLVKNQNLRIY